MRPREIASLQPPGFRQFVAFLGTVSGLHWWPRRKQSVFGQDIGSRNPPFSRSRVDCSIRAGHSRIVLWPKPVRS